MSRILSCAFLLLIALSLWCLMESELTDRIAAVFAMAVTALGLFKTLKGSGKYWLVLTVSAALTSAGMVGLLLKVAADADALARQVIMEGRCVAISSGKESWSDQGWYFQRNVAAYGAVRRMTYQKSGLFRYGFLYDDKRTVWLAPCAE